MVTSSEGLSRASVERVCSLVEVGLGDPSKPLSRLVVRAAAAVLGR